MWPVYPFGAARCGGRPIAEPGPIPAGALARTAAMGPQALAFTVLLARLGRGRRRRPPLSADVPAVSTVSVVIPARDEAARIGPCLDGLLADDDVLEVIVVDD